MEVVEILTDLEEGHLLYDRHDMTDDRRIQSHPRFRKDRWENSSPCRAIVADLPWAVLLMEKDSETGWRVKTMRVRVMEQAYRVDEQDP